MYPDSSWRRLDQCCMPCHSALFDVRAVISRTSSATETLPSKRRWQSCRVCSVTTKPSILVEARAESNARSRVKVFCIVLTPFCCCPEKPLLLCECYHKNDEDATSVLCNAKYFSPSIDCQLIFFIVIGYHSKPIRKVSAEKYSVRKPIGGVDVLIKPIEE